MQTTSGGFASSNAWLKVSGRATQDRMRNITGEELRQKWPGSLLMVIFESVLNLIVLKNYMKSKEDLYKNVPRELYDGDVTKNRMTPNEVHKLADKLLKKGFAEIKKKYF